MHTYSHSDLEHGYLLVELMLLAKHLHEPSKLVFEVEIAQTSVIWTRDTVMPFVWVPTLRCQRHDVCILLNQGMVSSNVTVTIFDTPLPLSKGFNHYASKLNRYSEFEMPVIDGRPFFHHRVYQVPRQADMPTLISDNPYNSGFRAPDAFCPNHYRNSNTLLIRLLNSVVQP